MQGLKIKFLSIMILVLVALSASLSFATTHNTSSEQTDRPVVKNYQIYYRSITDDILKDMQNFDMVILEALQLEEGMVATLKSSNTQVYGYISALEVATWDDALNAMITDNDLLTIDGRVMMHGKNPIGDLRKASFRSALLRLIDQRIAHNHLDGIFIDSTSVMNDYFDDDRIGPDLLYGYKTLLEEINVAYPQLNILQNRGFAYLETVADSIDGVVWENFDSPRANAIKRYQRRIDLLKSLPDHIDIYTISYNKGWYIVLNRYNIIV